MPHAGPVTQAERIYSLDTLRGFALLGILPANILFFGLHFAAANDPTVSGGAAGLNLASWALFHVLVEGKMRCLFSMVFGAGVILLTARAEEHAAPGPADIYYRRNLWLMVFGLMHAFLFFWGDILFPYAMCALILFPFRKLPAGKLLLIGGLFIAFKAGWLTVDAFRQVQRRDVAAAALAAQKTGRKPAAEQAEAMREMEAQLARRKPSPADLDKDARKWRGSPWEVISTRVKAAAPWQALPYYHPVNCDILSMMFIGMALFKLGIFGAARSYRFYAWTAAVGCLAGIPLNSYTASLALKAHFDRVTLAFTSVVYDLARLPLALAYVALLMIVCKAGVLRSLTGRLAAIGQTALSNYILHSLICTVVFTGSGFALYGRLERYQLYYVVAGCWVVSLVASPVWLRHYRFGPLEWCWRSLTYWHRQPMRSRRPDAAPRPAEAMA